MTQHEVVLAGVGLTKTYRARGAASRRGLTRPALKDVTVELRRGQVLGVIGESGSGKTTLARCLALLEPIDQGQILFEGEDTKGLKGKELRAHRRLIQTVFQDPMASLDPSQTVGSALTEVLSVHNLRPREERPARVAELLDVVGMPASAAHRRPAEFSGGQRQRICIARALAAEPVVLIADEAVSALDVSIQAQVLNLLLKLQRDLHLTVMFISHDLHVVEHVADHIVVMYAGEIVEHADAKDGIASLTHPYSQALAAAAPTVAKAAGKEEP
ncbi:MAG: ATP-binding cassette domain-containing protein [Bifidobacteriaceae bacterium]|jgi:oligopeptide transport system ATP-binding protein|nr:ATP-binding cassette domain-containing protein [Bifidobacteriaceae bacterium]